MAGKRTPLKNTRTDGADADGQFDDSVTETSFGGDDDDEDEEDGMTDAQRRKARGDSMGDDDDEEDEEDEGDEDEEGDEGEEEDEDEEDEEGEEEEDDEEGEEDDEEGEEGEEEEDEEALDAEALAAIAGTPKSIPYSRFQQVVAQNQQLIDALTRGGAGGAAAPAKEEPEPPPFDFKAKGKEYREALLNGEDDKAEALEAEIDAAKAAKMRADLLETVRQDREQERARQELATVQAVIAKVMKDYSIFNDEAGDDFDQEALDEMIGLRDAYMRKGMPQAEAIRKAADRIAQVNGLEVKGATKPAKPGKVNKSGKKPSVKGEDNRSVRDKRRALSNLRRTPANLGRAGTGNRAVPQVQDYGENGPSESQIRRMTDRQKAEARGDFVGKRKSGK